MLPPLSTYPPRIQKIIRRLNTPEKVQHWLESLQYNKADTMRTLPGVLKSGRAHCLEGVLSAAAILEAHGFPPLILDLESEDYLDHTLFLFQHDGKWGAVGKSRDIGLDGRKPVFRSVKALAQSYVIPYIDERACITSFGVLDLRPLRGSWRTSKRNVWYVEEALRRVRHHLLPQPREFVQRWRRRYRTYTQRHPRNQPDYYPGQRTWM